MKIYTCDRCGGTTFIEPATIHICKTDTTTEHYQNREGAPVESPGPLKVTPYRISLCWRCQNSLLLTCVGGKQRVD